MDKFDEQLTQKLQQLPREKQPEKALWSGIALALEEDEKSQPYRKRILPIAAAMALTGLISWQWLSSDNVIQDQGVTNGFALVEALSEQHNSQKQALLVQYSEQKAVTQNWEQQLAELDDAAKAVKAALKQDPDNTALLRMLQHVYQQQIDLIERVHAPKWQQI